MLSFNERAIAKPALPNKTNTVFKSKPKLTKIKRIVTHRRMFDK